MGERQSEGLLIKEDFLFRKETGNLY